MVDVPHRDPDKRYSKKGLTWALGIPKRDHGEPGDPGEFQKGISTAILKQDVIHSDHRQFNDFQPERTGSVGIVVWQVTRCSSKNK